MSNISQSIRVGAFFLLGVCLLWIVYETLSGRRIDEGDGYRLTATFEDIRQLKATSEVRMAGVLVGTVVGTHLDGTKAVVVMLIDKNVHIPADSKATVATAGMLGLSYLSISPGSQGSSLSGGDTIASVATPDLTAVMVKLDSVGTRLEGVLDSAQIVANNIASGKGTVGKLINEPAAYDQLMQTVADIQNAAQRASTFMDTTNEVVAHVKEGQGVLGAMIYDNQVADNLKVTVSNVRDFTTRLNNPDSSLGRFISDDTLYRQASQTLTKVDGAVSNMNDAGPITAVGVLANALF